MSEEKKEFIGPRQVESTEVYDMKTYGGNPVIQVTYKGGFQEIMPQKAYDSLVSPEPTDFSVLGAKKVALITKEVLAVLAEHHIQGHEIETITNSISNELYNSFNKATHALWTGETKSFTPGGNAVLEQSLLQAHKVITSIPNDEPTNEKSDNA